MTELTMLAEGVVSVTKTRSMIAALPDDLDADTARQLLVALRSWVWKALDTKRRDPELREWHDVMRRARSKARSLEAYAAQFQLLADLLHESVSVSSRRSIDDVLKLRNVREALNLLRDGDSDGISKKLLMEGLSLKSANATRLMNLLLEAGLAERVQHGREACFRLSREGFARAGADEVRRSLAKSYDKIAAAMSKETHWPRFASAKVLARANARTEAFVLSGGFSGQIIVAEDAPTWIKSPRRSFGDATFCYEIKDDPVAVVIKSKEGRRLTHG